MQTAKLSLRKNITRRKSDKHQDGEVVNKNETKALFYKQQEILLTDKGVTQNFSFMP